MKESILSIGVWISQNAGWLKIVSAAFSALLISRIIFYAIHLEKFSEPVKNYLDFSGKADKFVKKRTNKAWREIMEKFGEGSEMSLKLAIIRADHILEVILKNAGFPGKDIDERLQKTAAVQIPNLSEIREAHEARNRVFSDPRYSVSKEDTTRFLRAYQDFFSYIGFLG